MLWTLTLSHVRFARRYGFLSDCVPIRGERRKPYLLIGWLIYLLSNLALAFIGNPSIGTTIFFMFITEGCI